MAKRRKKHRRKHQPPVATPPPGQQQTAGVSVAAKEQDPKTPEESQESVPDVVAPSNPGAGAAASVGRAAPPAGGGLPIYKPGQGYYTRMGTTVGGAVLVLAGCKWLHDKLSLWANESWGIYVQNGAVVLLVAVFAGLLYWVSGSSRRTCDFMIATEGEMKKVSWSSKKEIIGSTKVVIGAVVIMALILFLVDMGFRELFTVVNVLRIGEAAE